MTRRVAAVAAAAGILAVATVVWAGVQTDKIVFDDETEMTTAPSAGAVDSVSGDGSYTTNSGTASDPVISLLPAATAADTLQGTVDAGNTATNAEIQVILAGETYAIETDGGIYVDGVVDGFDVQMGTDLGTDCALAATDSQGVDVMLAVWDSVGGYFTDGTRKAWVIRNPYAFETDGGVFVDGAVGGYDVYIGVDEATDYALRTTDGTRTVALSGNSLAIEASGDSKLDGDVIHPMTDAAGTAADWHEWAVGGSQDTDGNWRMGVVNSNFVVQVRVSGAWTNATQFVRP